MEYNPSCEKCKSHNMRIMGQCTLSAPAKLYSKFSKKNLRSKDVYLMGVNWETFDFICEDCGYTINNFGNYVTELKNKVKELEAKVKMLEK
jgi:aspartate/tyrosine/aromatic aminotransferase